MRTLAGWLLLTLALPVAGWAQEIELAGRIVDSESGEPIPYVNVGIPRQGLGTVSDADGMYRIATDQAADLVVFAAIGYTGAERPVRSLRESGDVALERSEYVETVEVSARAPSKSEVTLGHDLRKRYHSVGYASGQLGTQIGAHIDVKEPTRLESAHFVLNHVGGEKMLYRVNLYDMSSGSPGENLLRENVLLDAPQKTGLISVDLRSHNLIVDDDVLLSLEWIQDDDGAGNSQIMFRSRKRSRSNLYFRLTSHAPFVRGSTFPGAPSLALGFHLIGQTLD